MGMLKEFFKQQVFPGFSALSANREVQKIIDQKLDYEVALPEEIKDQVRFKADIENLIKSQLERKGKLEDKAKSLLFIISLAFTTATFSLNFLEETPDRIFSPMLAILGLCCFVFAGIRVISAINIRMFYVKEPAILHQAPDSENNIPGKLIVSEDDDDTEYLKDLVHNKTLNDLICTKIANLTYASFTLVRNGIICFACLFAVGIVVQFSTPNKPPVKKEQDEIKASAKPKNTNEEKVIRTNIEMKTKGNSMLSNDTTKR